MKITIYCLKDPTTLEIRYIGRTKNSLSKRLSDHICDSSSNHGTYKRHWISKLKHQNLKPIIESIKELDCSIEEAYKIELETIKEFFDKGYRLTNLEDKGCGSAIKCIKYSPLNRKIVQYSLEGKFISDWNSIAEAAKNTKNATLKGIHKNLKKYTKTAYGFQWFYKEEIPEKIISTDPTKHTKRMVKVDQFDLLGNFIKTWNGIIEAKESTGATNIGNTCNGIQKSSGGFIWKYTNKKLINQDIVQSPKKFGRFKPFQLVTKTNKVETN